MQNIVFTCIGRGHGAPAVPATEKEWKELRTAAWLEDMCVRIEKGETDLKSRLPVWTPRCAEFRNNHRAERDALAPLNRLIFDVDDKGRTDEIMAHLSPADAEGERYIGPFLVLLIEESVRLGTHVLVELPDGMSPKEAQEAFSREIGIAVDPAVKNVAGCVYMVSERHTRYESGKLTAPEGALKAPEGALKASGDALNVHSVHANHADEGENAVGISAPQEVFSESNATSVSAPQEPLAYNGFEYKDIISKYWALYNDGKEPCEGNRNTLTFELAMVLRHICGFDREKLNKVIPDYWQGTASLPREGRGGVSSEKLQCIDSALKEERKGMPFRLRQILTALKKEKVVRATGGTLSMPPEMPKRLPKLIQLLTKNVPDLYKPAVSNAVFPALATHLHGVKFRYWDNVEHEATFMNVLVGRQSIGKGCIKKPIELIMADIVERDKVSRQREAEWKRKNPMGKSKAKDPRPEDICIQVLIDNLTDAVFNQRIVDANANGQRYVYTSVDEIEALKKVTSKGSIDEVLLLIRKAFDNAMAGQERVGADSVSGIAPLRWNWNASTTPPNMRRFFVKGVSDGTISRLDVCTIINRQTTPSQPHRGEENSPQTMRGSKGEETYPAKDSSDSSLDDDIAPVMGIYDDAFVKDLRPYLQRLDAASGLIECPQSLRLALDMKQENQDMSRLYESEAYRVLSYRANVIAWLKGMLLYIAQGYKWDKTIEDFVRWSEQYNLWCKMLYFGNQLEEELREEEMIQNSSGPRNLLALLPEEFSKEDYLQMRISQGKQGEGNSTLRTWMARGYIVRDEVSGNYRKRNS